MNCVELAYQHAVARPDQIAIWMPGGQAGRSTTFGALFREAGNIQRYLVRQGIVRGDVVLLVDVLGFRLYAAVLGILGLGATVVLVEPWMQVKRIDQVVQAVKPSFFMAGLQGALWGGRVPSIRRVNRWLDIRRAAQHRRGDGFLMEPVDGAVPGILTFTSGTTGAPKGVVRTHQILVDQHQVLKRTLKAERETGSDLCIFANFTLANLASGRTTLLMPSSWKRRHLRQIDQLPAPLHPGTMTCGPAFLLALMRHARVPSLKAVHVGGALTDCWIFEEAFKRWPEARWTHIYGSTEAEPVAAADARESVRLSREKGFFQTLYLGRPIPDIRCRFGESGLWVTGPHVCSYYIGNDEANRLNKCRDETGAVWHFMGDRILAMDDDGGLWYRGRSNQNVEDFDLEQSIYTALQSSKCFVHRPPSGACILVGEVPKNEAPTGVDLVVPLKIYRDRRHRARIDRPKSLSKGAKWLAG